jgi:polygalacturonase
MKTTAIALAAAALCAQAFASWPLQERIDALAANGGGTLVLTAGVYRTGAIFFKPGVSLYLEKGATILGVDEAEGYPKCETRIEGETCLYYPALVNADRCDGFRISGEGVIDGHGANTWEEFWTGRAEARRNGREFFNKTPMRPRLLYVSRSKNVDVSGVTFKNSKFWTTHYYDCEDVVVHDCSIVAEILKDSKGNELKGPSTDAIDVDKCRRFTVRNVDISVNDDGVVVKGGKGAWADDYSKFPGNGPSTDVLVENCTFRHPTHSALTLGSECPAATNVTMRACRMDGCGNMINIKMRTDTPQRYANVLVEKCTGRCKSFFRVQSWSQYHDSKGRSPAELKSHADGVTLRDNVIEAKNVKDLVRRDDVFEISNLVFENNLVNGVEVK